eukprot:SAG22_NODE_11464_length_483_cov_87.661458_1_plen_156_part_01
MDKTQQMLQKIDRIAQLQNEINQSAPRLARVTQEQESAVQVAVRAAEAKSQQELVLDEAQATNAYVNKMVTYADKKLGELPKAQHLENMIEAFEIMAKTLRVKKTALDADEVAREKLKVKGREEDLLKVKEKQIAKYKGGVENYLANIRSARVGAA